MRKALEIPIPVECEDCETETNPLFNDPHLPSAFHGRTSPELLSYVSMDVLVCTYTDYIQKRSGATTIRKMTKFDLLKGRRALLPIMLKIMKPCMTKRLGKKPLCIADHSSEGGNYTRTDIRLYTGHVVLWHNLLV